MTAVALLCVGSAVCVAIAVVVRVLSGRSKRERGPVAVSLGYTARVVDDELVDRVGHHVALVRRER